MAANRAALQWAAINLCFKINEPVAERERASHYQRARTFDKLLSGPGAQRRLRIIAQMDTRAHLFDPAGSVAINGHVFK